MTPRPYRVVAALFTIGLASPCFPLPQCPRTVDLLAGGPALGVAAVGNLATVGSGSRLEVYDVSTPTLPRRVGGIDFGTPRWSSNPTCVTPLVGMDDLVVVSETCGERAQVRVVDLNRPTAPAVVATIEVFDRATHGFAVDHLAWIVAPMADGCIIQDTLLAIDLSDPADPLVVGSYPAQSIEDVAYDDHTIAILEASPSRLTLLDVRNPASPVVQSQTAIGGPAVAVELAGDRAYVSTVDVPYIAAAISVIDISDRSAPTPVMSVPMERVAYPVDLVAVRDRLVVGLREGDPQNSPAEGGLEIFDLSDPSRLQVERSLVFSSGASTLLADGNLLLVTDNQRGLRAFELDDLVSPVDSGLANPTFDEVLAVDVEGDLAYLADHGLRILDLGGSGNATELGALELSHPMVESPGSGWIHEVDHEIVDVDASPEGLVVLSTSDGRVAVVDASDPEHPVELADSELEHLSGAETRVALAGDLLAVVAPVPEGLVVLDLSDPSEPVELGRGTPSGYPTDVAIAGELAVVSTGRIRSGDPDVGGVDLFDLQDPEAPVLVGSIGFDHSVFAVDASGPLVVAVGAGFVHVLDVTDPSDPVEIGGLTGLIGLRSGVAIDGRRAFVSVVVGSLFVVDLSDPAHPRLAGARTWQPWTGVDGSPVGGFGVAVHRGQAVVADGTFGLRTFDATLCLDRPQTPAGASESQ